MNALLGNRVKELRNAKNFTQEQVASQIGISRQKYARIEGGVNSITLEVLSQIAKKVLDEAPAAVYRAGAEKTSSEEIFDMLDFFYANKNLYTKLQRKKDF